MPEARQPLEEQLERSQAGAEPAAGADAAAGSTPAAGSRPAAGEHTASGEDPAAPHADEAGAGAGAVDGHGAAGGKDSRESQQAESQQADAREATEDALKGDVDELVAVAAQRDEYLALAQRTQADFENYRKRVAKDSAASQERGVAKLASELLPALDNLDRALAEANAGAEQDGSKEALLEGVRLVRSELHAALGRVGIESFSPRGEQFDPSEHEAMAQKPDPEAASGIVVEVFQPGYRLGQSIIRPARVVVAA